MLIPSPGPVVPLRLPKGTSAVLGVSPELWDRDIGTGFVFGWGAATRAGQAAISVDCKEFRARADAHRVHDNTHFMHLLDETGRTFERIKMDIPGRQLTWSPFDPAPWQYKFLPLRGDKARLTQFVSPSRPGVTRHRVGFDPTAVFFFSAVNQDAPPAVRDGAHYAVGWAAANGQFCTAGVSRDGGAPLARGMHVRDRCLLGLITSGVYFSARCTLVPGGFDLDWDVANFPYYCFALAIDCPAEVFHFSEGALDHTFGFQPRSVIVQGGGKDHEGFAPDHRYHIGIAERDRQYSAGIQDQDGVPTTNPHRFRKNGRTIHRWGHDGTSLIADADVALVGHQVVFDWRMTEPGVLWSGVALG